MTTISYFKDTKNIDDFLIKNIIEIHYESENENTLRHRENGQDKYLQQILNSMNALLMFLVMSYVG